MAKSYAEKVAAIIAKADSSTHPEEAEMFMAKAHQLMRDHGITLLDLGNLDQEDPIGLERRVHHNFQSENWAKRVAGQLAFFYGCDIVHSRVGNKTYHSIAGRESGRITFTLMFPFVVRQVRQQAAKAVQEGLYTSVSRAKTDIGNALVFRIHSLRKEKDRCNDIDEKTQNALVPVDEIEILMNKAFPNVKDTKSRAIKITNTGVKLASEISLETQVGEGLSNPKLQ